MSDQDTRDKRRQRFDNRNKHRIPKPRRPGPTKAKRRQEPWCDEYAGDMPAEQDNDYTELDFND